MSAGKKRVFKTKKKLSSTRALYRPWKEWETGDIIIGTFKGQQTDNYDKPNWLLEVEEAYLSNKKDAKKFKGQVLGLNSAGKLDKAMEGVSEGDMVQIEYKGTSTIEKGKYKGKDAHDIEVDLVEPEGEEEETDDEEEVDDEDVDDDGEEEDEDEDDL